MGGRKTAGVVFSEAFELIKREYKSLWIISLIMYGVQMVLGIVMSVFTAPFQFFSVFLGPMIESVTRQGGYYGYGDLEQILRAVLPAVGVFSALYLVIIAVSIMVSIAQGAAGIGANNATLQLVDGGKPRFDAVWKNFARNWKRYVGIVAWMTLWTTLWSLLFIVPGIVKGYSYRLAPYLVLEYPDMPVRDALRKSMEMTQGYKGRLFLLDLICFAFGILSLLGLCFFVVGYYVILVLWLLPLAYALFAIAYRDIKAAAIEKGILPASQPLV